MWKNTYTTPLKFANINYIQQYYVHKPDTSYNILNLYAITNILQMFFLSVIM